ncbi:alpha/beta fold family hydrolase [methanogenic archaeon mixed culture ISO4-G1]|nr:alpha/beta fold family hydrolase [methanogenic archaeon mixed culture ISO4-G1]
MSIKEERIFIDGDVRLGATIAANDFEGKKPAIVLIMGTGNSDRDGNSRGFQTDMYKNFAWTFAEWGFVTIRYDKRGTHESGGKRPLYGFEALVNDAVSVVEYAKTLPYVDADKVIVFGHSEGGMIASVLSDRTDTAGLMIMGAAGMSMKDALHFQNWELAEEAKRTKGFKGFLLRGASNTEKNNAKVDRMFAKASATDKDKIFISGGIINAKWIREHDAYTADALIAKLSAYGKPILAVTGTKDLSADYKALDRLRGISNVECYVPEGVNHIFREVDDDNSVLKVKKQYMRLSKKPVHKGTEDKMHEWLSQFI